MTPPTSATGAPLVVLMADDDPDDVLLTRDALAESGLPHEFHAVAGGPELLRWLRGGGAGGPAAGQPWPGVVLLDLNMPRMDGLQVLGEIRGDAALRVLPVIVFTTSRSPEDVRRCYEAGASTFMTKPQSFTALVDAMRALQHYWGAVATLPPAPEAA